MLNNTIRLLQKYSIRVFLCPRPLVCGCVQHPEGLEVNRTDQIGIVFCVGLSISVTSSSPNIREYENLVVSLFSTRGDGYKGFSRDRI